MQFAEAAIVSFINTIIVVALYVIRTSCRRRVEFHGPFAYKVDETGALREISADSVPTGVLETLRERIQSKVKQPESIMLKKTAIAFFAFAIFIVQLIILSAL